MAPRLFRSHAAWALLLLASAPGLAGCRAAQPEGLRKVAAEVLPSRAMDLCRELVSPKFAGRLTGTPGFTAAAVWAGEQFKTAGLAAPEGGALQAYPAECTVVEKAEMTLFLPDARTPSGWREESLSLGRDFFPLLFTDSGTVTAPLVFAGWGIRCPETGYDDYEGLDIQGRLVVCFRGVPDPADIRYTPLDVHARRMETARSLGAVGLLYIDEQPKANPNGHWMQGFFPAEISTGVADRLFEGTGKTAAELRNTLVKTRRPVSMVLPPRLRLRMEAKHEAAATGYNVLALVPGTDPALSAECVVVGGHLDHCGTHAGFLFSGANDNASGASAVLEAARALAHSGLKPRRSVLFVLFGGEESGLLGSRWLVDHLPAPFMRVTAMFNLDMVGAGDGAWCGFTEDTPELRAAVEEADRILTSARPPVGRSAPVLQGGMALQDPPSRGEAPWGYTTPSLVRSFTPLKRKGRRAASDHSPFAEKGWPAAMLISSGPHPFYHQPGDTLFRVNPEIMGDMARLALLAALQMADR